MLPNFTNAKVSIERTLGDGTVTSHTSRAFIDPDNLTVPVETDVQSGDTIVHLLTNSNEQRYRVIDVHQMVNPLGLTADHIKVEYEKLGRGSRVTPSPVQIAELHSDVSSSAGALFADGHFDKAVFEAFKAIEHRIQQLSGATDIGKSLASRMIGSQLDPSCPTMTERNRVDEREGYKLVFMGAFAGIRNPRGHGQMSTPTDEPEAKEMLALASLLMRRLDRAERSLKETP